MRIVETVLTVRGVKNVYSAMHRQTHAIVKGALIVTIALEQNYASIV